MNNRLHIRNAVHGMLLSLVALFLIAIAAAVFIPVLRSKGLMDNIVVRVLPLTLILGFQFLVCFFASKRCERMLNKRASDSDSHEKRSNHNNSN